MCQSALYDLLLDFVRTSPAGPVLTFAILGGDGRFGRQDVPGCVLRTFEGGRSGGNGELRRFERALKAGSFDRVIVLARWNGHSVTRRALRLCRRLGIPFTVHP